MECLDPHADDSLRKRVVQISIELKHLFMQQCLEPAPADRFRAQCSALIRSLDAAGESQQTCAGSAAGGRQR